MIVYPAYIYMGGDGGPVNPVIFQKNEINYKYSGTNFTVTTDSYFELQSDSELVFSGLDLSNFEKLGVQVNNRSSSTVTLTINFIDSSGNVSANTTWHVFKESITSRGFTIPTEYRKPKTKIKFSSDRKITMYYAKLS